MAAAFRGANRWLPSRRNSGMHGAMGNFQGSRVAQKFRAGTEGLHRRYAFCMLHGAMGGGPFVVATFESHIMCFFLLDLK